MVHSTAKERWKRPTKGGRPAGNGKNKGAWKKAAPKEITFDDDARREYLTGFSKRKKEKLDAAKQRAQIREKEEAKQLRQQLRTTRREQAANNVKIANDFYGGAPMIDATQVDFDFDMDNNDIDPEEQEYSNDEMTTRVVIEEFRLSDDEVDEQAENRSNAYARQRAWRNEHDTVEQSDGEDTAAAGPSSRQMDDRDRNINVFSILPHSKAARTASQGTSSSRSKAKSKADSFATPNDTPEKKKKPTKRFTYETKAARRAESLKQKTRRKEKAESSRSGSAGKTGRGLKSSSKKGGKRR